MNQSCSIASTNPCKPACSLLTRQLHTTCWVLSRECGQQVTGELMKCQSGGREIACITYPQGALVVFPRISHTQAKYIILHQGWFHNVKNKVLSSSHNLLLFCSPAEIRPINGCPPSCPRHLHIIQRSGTWRHLIAWSSANPFIKTSHYSLARLHSNFLEVNLKFFSLSFCDFSLIPVVSR